MNNQNESLIDTDKHCICCGSVNEWKKVTSLPSFLFGRDGTIYQCPECGLGRTSPEPETSIEYYEDNRNYDSLFLENRVLYEGFARSLLELVKDRAQGENNSFLDIGCGGGFLVSAANDMGFSALGIDANRNVIQWAQAQGIAVEQGDVEERLSRHEQYDVVVLSAVLEHLSDPEALLLQTKELLKPDGVLLVSQASFDGLLPRLFPWGWYAWQPQEHFWHFTPDSFTHLATSCGFEMVQCTRNSLHHQYYSSGGLKAIVGRNIATLIARIGDKTGKGDNFDCLLRLC